MNTILEILLNSVNELELCIDGAKKAILEVNQDDAIVMRLNFYDEALEKIVREVDVIGTLNENDQLFELNQSIKRIVELSNMIRQDSLELVLSLEQEFESTVDPEKWN